MQDRISVQLDDAKFIVSSILVGKDTLLKVTSVGITSLGNNALLYFLQLVFNIVSASTL